MQCKMVHAISIMFLGVTLFMCTVKDSIIQLFSLHLLQTLLGCGADPRMHADDGAVPEQVCAQCVVVGS